MLKFKQLGVIHTNIITFEFNLKKQLKRVKKRPISLEQACFVFEEIKAEFYLSATSNFRKEHFIAIRRQRRQ